VPDGPEAPAATPAASPAWPAAAPYTPAAAPAWAAAAPYDPAAAPAWPAASPYGPGAPYANGGPPKPGVNGFAIAAFVLGLIGGGILSVIFGIVALVKIRKRPQRGKGLAIAGLCLTGVWVLALVAILVVHAQTTSQRSSATGQITKPGHLDALSLQTGDCFQNPTGSTPASEVDDVTAVPCTTPHDAQVIAELPVAGSAYPGEAAFRTQAESGCQAKLKAVVDQSKVTSTMNLLWIYPEEDAWTDGMRHLSCLVVNDTKDVTSSLMK
jgi:hypothetical protein